MIPSLDNQSRAGVPIAVVTVTLVIATIAVFFRSYTRIYLVNRFGIDDWAAALALVLAIGSGIAVAINTLYGAGRHMWTLDAPAVAKYFRIFYVSIVIYNAALMATKATFLLQYYRVLGTDGMRIVILAALVLVGMWSTSQLLIVIFTCSPVAKFWEPTLPGKCIPDLPFWYINAAGNILTDAIIFTLPLPVLSSLQLPPTQKYLLMGIFSLGFFTCAISIIRIQYLHLSSDVTWDNVASSCWSIGELASGITCACLPTLRPLVSQWVPSLRSHVGKSSNGYLHRSSRIDSRERAETPPLSESGDLPIQMFACQIPELRDAALQRSESEDLSDGIMGLASARKHNTIADQLHGDQRLGLRATVQTEIRAATPQPELIRQRCGQGGISVDRDVTMKAEAK